MSVRGVRVTCVLLAFAGAALAQAAPEAGAGPEGEPHPLLRVEGGGPTAQTTALAFGPDGRTLYAAGYDKVVRVWEWDENAGAFALQGRAYRIPIGPGTVGTINRLAVSPDGAWLAVTGLGVARGEAGFREEGIVLPVADTWTDEQFRDQGLIHLFRLQDGNAGKPPAVRILRGHRGVVVAMTFAPAVQGGGPVLVSAAREPRGNAGFRGRVLAWDVDRAAPLGEMVVPEVNSVEPPGLAVRRTGTAAKDLRVALAWHDGMLRTWDVAEPRDHQPEPVPDGDAPSNGSAVFLPGPRLLTGGFTSGEGGYLQLWKDAAGRPPERADRQPFAARGFGHIVPRALCPVPSGEGVSHVAGVFLLGEKNTGREFYRLYLLSPDTLHPESRTPLWDYAGGDPTLACSPDGRFVAVAGPGTRSVHVYQTADLLQGRDRPQELVGVGTVFQRLAFARKGAAPELGLFLGTANAEDAFLFDFANRRLTGDPAVRRAWSAAGPEGWSVSDPARPGATGDHELKWSHGDDRGSVVIHLEQQEELTAFAVAPPLPGVTTDPTLAVATWKGQAGEPLLALYEARTGEPVRQLKGHAGPITALAVSPDGKFLASAATDETVCLWSLTDLDRVIGKHGRLTGASLTQRGDDLVVERAEKGSPAADSLEAGDRITGLSLRPGDPKPRTGLSPLQFYLALWDVAPGKAPAGTVTLRVLRGGRELNIPLQVEQGVDDRKPVLSVFVAPGDEEEPRWIAWTPFGPFDSSGPDAERYVGWHLNPSRIGEPARFADIGQYRKEFFRPQLLPLLLASGDLSDVLKKLKVEVPRPVLHVVSVAGQTRPDRENQFLVREPQVPLHFTIEGPSLDRDEVGSVVVTVDGKPGPHVDPGTARGQELATTVDVGERGIHTVHVEARTAGDSPRVGTTDVQVRYQPPPPEVNLPDLPQDATEVKDADYTFRAKVAPAPSQKAQVSLFLNDKPVPVEAGLAVEKALKLEHGPNTIRLTAVNEGALKGYEEWETKTVPRTIDYKEPEAAKAIFAQIVPLSGADKGSRLKVSADTVALDSGRVRLLGTVTAPEGEKLTLVQLLRKTAKGEKPVAEFNAFAEEGRALPLDRVVALEEGPQDFTLLAKTAHKESRSPALHVEYRPPLPDLAVIAPREDSEITQDRDRSPVSVPVRVSWPLSDEFHPFTVAVRVLHDDKPVRQDGNTPDEIVIPFRTKDEAAEFSEAAAARAAAKPLTTVRLAPGRNRVEVQARNPWRDGQVTARTVTVRRPPFLVEMKAESPVTSPFTTVSAVAESPSELPLTAVRVNGQLLQLDAVVTDKKPDPKKGVTAYTLRVGRVALGKLGPNPVRLEVRNEDGPAEETRTVEVKERPRPAAIRPMNVPSTLDRLPYDLWFQVTSDSALLSIDVKLGDRSLLHQDRPQRDQNGKYMTAVPLKRLDPGVNNLVIEAVNAGGRQPESIDISYVPRPLRLVVDPPQPPRKGAITEVHGRLQWADPDQGKEVEKKAPGIAVYVNDFLQPPADVRMLPGNELEFTARAVLNGAKNRVHVECPGLKLESGSVTDRFVKCDEPEKPGTLRLLIVNNSERIPRDDLVRHALAALQLTPQGNQLKSAVFGQVVSYPRSPDGVGAVTGCVTQKMVLDRLQEIENDIRDSKSPSDVVLIYWLGKDVVEDQNEWYLPTRDGELHPDTLEKTAVRLDRLLATDERVLGGRVLLLDVASGGQDQVSRPNWRSSRTAVLRYAWSEKAVPLPALLVALERAAKGRQAVSLQDLATAALELLNLRYAGRLTFTNSLSSLSGLTLSGGATKP